MKSEKFITYDSNPSLSRLDEKIIFYLQTL